MASRKTNDIPVALLDGTCVWVPSRDAAALTALERLPYGSKEFAGAIYRNQDGNYCYSVPIKGTNDNFQFRTDQSGGLIFDGMYHTHPGGEHEGVFSPNDVSVAEKLKRTSYIRANNSGEVRRYDPGMPTQGVNKPGSITKADRIAAGELLGNLKKDSLDELLRKWGKPAEESKLALAAKLKEEDQLR